MEAYQPVARYFSGMDFLMYLMEDVSYRADQIDLHLTILYHPYEERRVGLKIENFRGLRKDMTEFTQLGQVIQAAERAGSPFKQALLAAEQVDNPAPVIFVDPTERRSAYYGMRTLLGDVKLGPEADPLLG